MNTSRENFVGSAALVIKEYTGFTLPLEKVDEIVGEAMKNEYTNFEYTEVSRFMDTAPREEIVDLVSLHYIGRTWPTYGEAANMDEFLEVLDLAMAVDAIVGVK